MSGTRRCALRDTTRQAHASSSVLVELHSHVHDVLGEGNRCPEARRCAFATRQADEAQASFERAVDLHRQAHSVLGEANDVQSLGCCAFGDDTKLDEAQASFERCR